jgi:hypothetical protein
MIIEPSADALSVCALKEVQRLGPNSFVQTIRGSFVQQIEPSPDALSMEEVVKLFSTAFEQNFVNHLSDSVKASSLALSFDYSPLYED